jgi:hypothetical protein
MSERTVKHSTNVVERSFKAAPGNDWEIAKYENDFRVGKDGHDLSFRGNYR